MKKNKLFWIDQVSFDKDKIVYHRISPQFEDIISVMNYLRQTNISLNEKVNGYYKYKMNVEYL